LLLKKVIIRFLLNISQNRSRMDLWSVFYRLLVWLFSQLTLLFERSS